MRLRRTVLLLVAGLTAVTIAVATGMGEQEQTMDPIIVNFRGIDCTWFVIFRDPDLPLSEAPTRFDIGPDDMPAIVVSAEGRNTYRFIRRDHGPTARMHYRQLGVGSIGAPSRDRPQDADAIRVQYDILAVATSTACDPRADAPYYELRGLLPQVRERQ